ncbi:hypothetical protein N8H69_05235 [Achromobacter spanius]|uniref:hypothetical protein n=1 Tax=Achromobacter spanius TaxID=217203 RepID=UPI002227DC10|nr:hypothetical protein [Achromobacter spanius]MCW3151928.1 hypothetical protein [Achromobacter spanius]
MRKAAPMTFGARLAARRFTKEEIAWFFNVPTELLSETPPVQAPPPDTRDKIQIGPLDV